MRCPASAFSRSWCVAASQTSRHPLTRQVTIDAPVALVAQRDATLTTSRLSKRMKSAARSLSRALTPAVREQKPLGRARTAASCWWAAGVKFTLGAGDFSFGLRLSQLSILA